MGDLKRKHVRWNHAVKQKCVESGLSGLFLTCDGYEKQSIAEAYNIIDQLMESAPKTEEATNVPEEPSDHEGEDVADSLKRICSERRDVKSKERRCKQRPTGVKNCLFVTVKDADVVDLAERMVERAQATPICRHLQRVLPVEETADCDLKKLAEMIGKCVSRHLVAKPDGSLPSYAMEFKSRNNDSIKRATVLEMLDEAVIAVAPSAKVNLNAADVLFYVQIVRKTMMVGGIPRYHERRKYSMRPTVIATEVVDQAKSPIVSEETTIAVGEEPTNAE